MSNIRVRRHVRRVRPRRRGVALFGVMICFIAISLLTVSWFKSVNIERQQLRTVQRRLQVDWLAEAALDRAVARLADKPAYRGETWRLSAAELSGHAAASVAIEVKPVAGRPNRRRIEIVADYPTDSVHRVRQRRQLIIALNAAGSAKGPAKGPANRPVNGPVKGPVNNPAASRKEGAT